MVVHIGFRRLCQCLVAYLPNVQWSVSVGRILVHCRVDIIVMIGYKDLVVGMDGPPNVVLQS